MKKLTMEKKRYSMTKFSMTVFVLLMLIVGAIPLMRHTLSSIWNNPMHLTALTENPQIHYENGALEYARYVADILSDCINQIEAAQEKPFAKPITIGVYNTKDAYASANGTGHANAAGMTTFMGNVVLSPDLFIGQRQRLRAILTHELSHAHLRSHLSILKYIHVPNWFKEGLAVMVSGGGGAEQVAKTEALNAIRKGIRISMENKGSLFHVSKIAFENETDELVPFQMQYKQASLFVEYLNEKNTDGFKIMLSELLEGQSFEKALFAGFHTRLDTLWSEFAAQTESFR